MIETSPHRIARARGFACGVSLACSVFFLIPSPACASKVASRTIRCDDATYHYKLFSPDKTAPLPAILLLHGAGDIPENMISAWEHFAAKNRIALIAPELPRDPKFEPVAPAVFRCVAEDAKTQTMLDSRRLYVFGNSMGGYLAYDAAMFDSNYFAAVAVSGMVIASQYDWIVTRAKRKTPVAIYIGDRDQFSSLASARKTRDLLVGSGFPVHYVELKNHDHDYYAVSDRINSDAWQFFQAHPLPNP